MHLSPELFDMVQRGELPAEVFVRAVYEHLMETCEGCRHTWDRHMEHALPPTTTATTAPTTLGKISTQETRLSELKKERRQARRDLRMLLAVPLEQRQKKIENARSRFRSQTFVELLAEESRRLVRKDPQGAKNLASLVPVAIHWMAGGVDPAWATRMTALASAYQANSLRVVGDLRSADRQFSALHRRLQSQPIDHSATLAEITSLEAALRHDQRRYSQGQDLLDRTVLLYRLACDPKGVARSHIQKGNLSFAQSQFDQAVENYELAASALDPKDDPFLYQCTVTGQVNACCELEQFETAAALLAEHRDLYDASEDFTAYLARGMDGRIAVGLERWVEAETAYAECRDGYLALGREHDATLACLDLMQVLLAQGKIRQLTEMAMEVLEIFRARGASQEALSTLLLVRKAAAAQTLTMAWLSEVRQTMAG